MANDVKQVLREAAREGWVIERGGKHFKLKHPTGVMVCVSVSTSDFRAAMNIRADLRRALRNGRVR